MIVNHGVGFESTLNPRGPVNYNVWFRGSYDKHYYSIINK